jgi:hypothetical protein
MASGFYNSFKKALLDETGNINLATDTFKVMLVTAAYAPDFDAHSHRSDVTNEVAGTGYTAGGQAITGQTVTQDNANDRGKFTATNVSWASSTITARAAVFYKVVGSAATDLLVFYLDFGANFSSSNGPFSINWDATNGIITLT